MFICGKWKFILGDPLKDPKEANHSNILWGGEITNENGYNKHVMGSGENSTIISMLIVLDSTIRIPQLEAYGEGLPMPRVGALGCMRRDNR